MKDHKHFQLYVSLLVFSRAFDVVTTALYIPTLDNETNIIVSWFGGGWNAVLVTQVILTLAVIILFYIYCFKFPGVRPLQPQVSLTQYVSYFYFYDLNSFHRLLYRVPKNKLGFLAASGYVAMMTLIVAGILVGTSTTFLLLSPAYQEFYRHGMPIFLITATILFGAYFSRRFFVIELRKHSVMS